MPIPQNIERGFESTRVSLVILSPCEMSAAATEVPGSTEIGTPS
jgi:hypothetical protein